MERQKKVVDASAIIKWFLHEGGSEEAIELKEKHVNNEIQLIVPELIFLEVLNALRYKNLDEERLKQINNLLWDINFEVKKLDSTLLNNAIKISIKYDLSIYDAIYAALAEINNCQLVTFDNKLKKVPMAEKV
jgi:predicted nucleic acid-binding protein